MLIETQVLAPSEVNAYGGVWAASLVDRLSDEPFCASSSRRIWFFSNQYLVEAHHTDPGEHCASLQLKVFEQIRGRKAKGKSHAARQDPKYTPASQS